MLSKTVTRELIIPSSSIFLILFQQGVLSKYDQIIEAYRLTGSSTDYLLKIVAPSIEEYDKFQQQLINEVKFTNMSSSIALKEIKKIHSLPLDYI